MCWGILPKLMQYFMSMTQLTYLFAIFKVLLIVWIEDMWRDMGILLPYIVCKMVLPSREIKQSLRKECRTWKRVREITFCQATYTFTFAVVGNHHHGWRWQRGKTQSYPTSRWYLYPTPSVSRHPAHMSKFPGPYKCTLQVASDVSMEKSMWKILHVRVRSA